MTVESAGGNRRAGIYARISADREGRELGITRQEQDCRALAERLGYAVVEVFRDNDLSASSRSRKPRPDWRRMLDAASGSQLDAILAYSTSRLTRRPREFEDLIDLAEDGVVIATVRAGDLDLNTARGRYQARQDANRDAAYSEEISELAKRAKEQRREQGLWHGGNRPFGWEKDGITPRPEEQKLLAAAGDTILEGRSAMSIGRMWTEAGVERPQGGKRWSGAKIAEMLRRPRIAGLLPDGRPACWEAVIPEDRWRALLAILSDPARRPRGGPRRLLTAIAECAQCGAHLRGGLDRHGRSTYRCSASAHLDRLAAPVERYVVDVVLGHLAEQKPVPADVDGETGRLATAAMGLRAQLDEATDLWSAGVLTTAQLTRSSASLRTQLAAAEARLASSAGSVALLGVPLDEPSLRAYWGEADIERRRAILRAARLRIRVSSPGRGRQAFDPETVQITPTDDQPD